MIRQYIYIAFAMALAASASFSQPAGEQIRSDAETFLRDGGDIFSAPAHFNGSDWLNAGALVGAVVLAYSVDEPVRETAQSIRTEQLDTWLKIGDYCGRPEAAGLVGGGLFLAGLAAGNEYNRVTGRMVFEAVIYSGIITTGTKSLLGRSRPYTNEGARGFHFLQLDNDFLSHPSGHSTLSFAVATVLSRRIGNTYASVLIYLIASLTPVQRIVSDNHWLSDTILGAGIGTAVGNAVVDLEERRRNGSTSSDTYIPVGASPHAPLFQVGLNF